MKSIVRGLAVISSVLCFGLPVFAHHHHHPPIAVPEGSSIPMLAVSGLVLLAAVLMKRKRVA
jgi:hypothetical protein